MRVLFETDHLYLPQRVGGSEASIHAFALGLKKRQHDTAVLARLDPSGVLGWYHRARRKLSGRPVADHAQGYAVYRAWDFEQARPEVIGRLRPDVVVIEGSFPMRRAAALAAEGRCGVVFLRHCEWHRLGGEPPRCATIRYVANSTATARAYAERFAIEAPVLTPVIDRSSYQCCPRPRHVTFVNPVAEKGLEVAIEIARLCPDIPFVFVRAWPRPEAEWRELTERLARLGNVRMVGPLNDMRKVYRTTSFLLVPSQWFEAWGRVVTEAQVSGIPAIASDSGGLPEAVGRGGLILPRQAPAERWAEAVQRLWYDQRLSASLAEQARQQAARPEVQPAGLMARFERLLAKAVSVS